MNKIRNKMYKSISLLKRRKIDASNFKDFTIISQNCLGGIIYHRLGMKFLSPTINLYFESEGFLKFCENLEYYLDQELKLKELKTYPVCLLDDITIHFLHYHTFEEAKQKWNQRKQRINKKNMFIIYTDNDGYKEEYLNRFLNLKYKNKIMYSSKKIDNNEIIYIPNKKDCVGDITAFDDFSGEKIILSEGDNYAEVL